MDGSTVNSNQPVASQADERPVRIVIFGTSVVSEWGNPAATTSRAILHALTTKGHDAVFLEQRGNAPTVELLKARGADALRDFADAYPDIRYRTYDLPEGLERAVWLGREVSTADAVVVQEGAPDAVIEDLARFDTPRLVRLYQITGVEVPGIASRFDGILAPFGVDVPRVLTLGPALDPPESADLPRDGVTLVAYAGQDAALEAATALATLEPRLISVGEVTGDRWEYLPEVRLREVYARARLAVVLPGSTSPLATARALLPVAHGCPAIEVLGKGDPVFPPFGHLRSVPAAETLEAVQAALTPGTEAGVPALAPALLATNQALALVDLVRQRRRTQLA